MAGDDDLPSAREIMAIHEEIEEVYDLKYRGARVAAPRLDLKRIRRETRSHDDVWMRAAYLLRKLITSHLYEDVNKRTAWLTTEEYLERTGLSPAADDTDAIVRVLRAIRAFDVDEIANWLETGSLDEEKLHP